MPDAAQNLVYQEVAPSQAAANLVAMYWTVSVGSSDPQCLVQMTITPHPCATVRYCMGISELLR